MGWIIETILTDEPSSVDVDWDTWNIGVVEKGRFRVVYTCFCEEDAIKLKSALEIYDMYEAGVVPGEIPKYEPPSKRAKKA